MGLVKNQSCGLKAGVQVRRRTVVCGFETGVGAECGLWVQAKWVRF